MSNIESPSIAEIAGQNVQLKEDVAELREQVSTLEELLQLYEESATDQAQRLQKAMAPYRQRWIVWAMR